MKGEGAGEAMQRISKLEGMTDDCRQCRKTERKGERNGSSERDRMERLFEMIQG